MGNQSLQNPSFNFTPKPVRSMSKPKMLEKHSDASMQCSQSNQIQPASVSKKQNK
jgi:hypothetical protein